MAQDDKPKRVEQTLILPREPDPGAAGEPAPDADDDFHVLALDTFKPQPVPLGPACRDLQGFAVFINRAAVTNIMRHGAKGLETNHEVAGGLVGRPCIEPETGLLFTHISAAWAVQGHADQYEVEISPEEWLRLSNMAHEEEAEQGARILVGWYHSHPTFDAYLSALDQQTQRQFFGEQWNVAIVIGPQRRQIKTFHSGRSLPCMLYLDLAETGGELVPVTYEVSAGGVSTTSGIEWVDAPDPADDDEPFVELPPSDPGTNYATSVLAPEELDPGNDPGPAYQGVQSPPPAPQAPYPAGQTLAPVEPGSPGSFSLTPTLLIVGVVILLIVITLLLLLVSAVRLI